MDRFDRIYHLHKILSNRRTPIPLKQIMEHLECSKSTADRIIELLRDHLNAPLEYTHRENGYFYNQQSPVKPYELPGLWFSAEELHGLLICQQILQNISPGILSRQIGSLQKKINSMLSREHSPQPVIADKIHFASIGRRLKDDGHFKRIAAALFSQKQIRIQYRPRGLESPVSDRKISPQKLIYHRENWYLAAYCHYRNGFWVFSVDCVHSSQILDQNVRQTAEGELRDFLYASYGIFTGKAEHTARLKFSENRAKWVADEHWHPLQQGQWMENGDYQLSIPFSDSRELIMDILKYGADVEVIEPEFLRRDIIKHIETMQKKYQK